MVYMSHREKAEEELGRKDANSGRTYAPNQMWYAHYDGGGVGGSGDGVGGGGHIRSVGKVWRPEEIG